MRTIEATFDGESLGVGPEVRRVLGKKIPGAVALALTAGLGAWVLHARLTHVETAGVDPGTRLAAEIAIPAELSRRANPFGPLVDPGFGAKLAPSESMRDYRVASLTPPQAAPTSPLLEEVPLPPRRDVARVEEVAPLPPPRPAEFRNLATEPTAVETAPRTTLAPPPAVEPLAKPSVAAAKPSGPGFLEKLFSSNSTPGSTVAYATNDPRSSTVARSPVSAPVSKSFGGGLWNSASPIRGYDKYTAVYDISARVVYLPDGTRLEAHSGYGDLIDDPKHVNEHGRGATPPNVYELTPREAIFHGVKALRMKPIGDKPVFGRAGLLAHSYMLGPNGDSNGCVSFADYDAFLHAYESGQVKKLAVVAKLD